MNLATQIRLPELKNVSPEQIVATARQSGVVGAGGAGFPTYVKLQSKAEIFLVNAAECEPMLKVDQQLMVTEAQALIQGLRYGMQATGAKEGIIALKEKYRQAIATLTPLLPENVRLHILPDVYPAGDEVITIWLATGRRVPPAQLPITIGVVVNNVQSLINLAKAIDEQHPVTHRTLTINGAIQRPMTLSVPLGTKISELIEYAGGCTVANPAFINGGPMMGKYLADIDTPVTKTTGGILVFPDDHLLIKRRLRSNEQILAMAKTVCEQCRLCTDLCPRHLIGHELSPHLLVKSMGYKQFAKPSTLLSALTCSECSVCESYACPVEISPMRINQMLKAELRAANVRYEGEIEPQDPMAEHRMVPISRLISRLNLQPYYQEAPLTELSWTPERVDIPLQQHIGAPSVPVVHTGDQVRVGDCIAEPASDALSVGLHASITGTVTDITNHAITLCRG
ncbi:4Fe-4S dicluster domain-containing protein [Vibrio mangrovi]|uniref:Electron transport complex protein RnfC n=1 Tax=Vibrio mangrovi TaxID=474394 RepID=A0A1Y6IY99_9VIBR|nr:4Fe-4S dicluster domain-containing protein [Vibrio mangrovi]MDW6005172.1 SLBB domain-containing protein [Vibrio mangrovi]SMS02618.1 Electron transport complex protein RnfC [Vibrio mangrovi]